MLEINFTRFWYRPFLHLFTILLLPFSFLFFIIVSLRRWLYRVGLLRVHSFKVPVIAVGNITVGGTGKTPLVIWLAHYLRELGYKPGIVTRGVGGKKQVKPLRLSTSNPQNAETVGDEALMLAANTQCDIVVCVDRVAAVHELLQNSNCNIVISDDGLQHYRMGRDIEIAVIDGMRRLGNKCLLPAGPLRENEKRLREVDFVIVNGGDAHDDFTMSLEPKNLISLVNPTHEIALHAFPSKKIHAIAGIGNPERFFTLLRNAGFELIPHVFKDHYLYKASDLHFPDSLPIFMTEKDAVKCQDFANDRCWYLPVFAKIDAVFQDKLAATLTLLEKRNETEHKDSNYAGNPSI